MASALQVQLEAYGNASWEFDHQRAMQCRDLEDWLDFGLALLEAIRRIDRRFQERAREGTVAIRPEAAEEIHRLYESWYSPCEPLLRKIGQVEAEGFDVENAEAFRAACRSAHLPGFEPEHLQAAAEQFAQGRGRPLREVVDGILRGGAVG